MTRVDRNSSRRFLLFDIFTSLFFIPSQLFAYLFYHILLWRKTSTMNEIISDVLMLIHSPCFVYVSKQEQKKNTCLRITIHCVDTVVAEDEAKKQQKEKSFEWSWRWCVDVVNDDKLQMKEGSSKVRIKKHNRKRNVHNFVCLFLFSSIHIIKSKSCAVYILLWSSRLIVQKKKKRRGNDRKW